jgi:hypothetical protein
MIMDGAANTEPTMAITNQSIAALLLDHSDEISELLRDIYWGKKGDIDRVLGDWVDHWFWSDPRGPQLGDEDPGSESERVWLALDQIDWWAVADVLSNKLPF